MPKAVNPLRRQSSTLSPLKRTKPASKTTEPRLEDVGSISSLPPAGIRQDIVSLIKYIQDYSFDDIPSRAGMNSTQISTTLRFRAALPPIASMAHLHALSSSPTLTERELARLTAQGIVRKVSIPGRGKGGAAIGDGIVLFEDWQDKIVQHEALSDQCKQKYIDLMRARPLSSTTSTTVFDEDELRALVTAGFLTTPAALSASINDLFSAPTTSASLLNVSTAGSSAPAGSMAAIGGAGAVHESGGSGSMLATSANRSMNSKQAALQAREMTFSLPNTGAYLKLLASARAHIAFLLRQMSPKWREGSIDLLREKWNGGLGNFDVAESKRIRGEGNGLLAGKTRRWREFMGLTFDYVLAEALGGGVLELFDTPVGPAVRLRS